MLYVVLLGYLIISIVFFSSCCNVPTLLPIQISLSTNTAWIFIFQKQNSAEKAVNAVKLNPKIRNGLRSSPEVKS